MPASPVAKRSPLQERLLAAARLVAGSRDLLEGRPGGGGGGPPGALSARGWDAYLLALDDGTLDALEIAGADAPWSRDAPEGLVDLARRVRDVCALPVLSAGASNAPASARRRGESPRKRAQIDAFGRLLAPLAAGATRVVDVGSGHGHLTREIAQACAAPVVGLERDRALASKAHELSSATPAAPTFTVTDVLRDGLALGGGDCVVGLHACGELGDLMVCSVAQTSGARLALVGCCPQKRRQTSRLPLCPLPDGPPDALELPRGLLGLGNLSARDEGVEATRAQNLLARERRLALHRLLSEGGPPLRLGAEIEGVNRRVAHRPLPELVARAYAARGQPAPSPQAIERAAAWAAVTHARSRRLSVPRALLARVLEVYVLLDRAAYLERRGFSVQVGTLFPPEVSPRNLALVAS